MKAAVMQPYFFPYIGYWQLINSVDVFVVFDDVNYIKRGYINRNQISDSNGNLVPINLLISKASQNRKINEHSILGVDSKFMRTISHVYKSSKNYEDAIKIIDEIICSKETNLAKYLGNSLKVICKYLDIKTEIIYSSDIDIDTQLKGSDRIISICSKMEVKEYINAIGGKSLYDKGDFLKNDISLSFIRTNEIKYEQPHGFLANLSIIDLLMNCTKDEIKKHLINYKLES